ncbi:MAG: GTP-binding protein [Alphaproteobacteria bacterium]|nr:GTP-binding protein [Alphaproteobacteria bacterium]MCY3752834.1 GTP-binding protein [Alphaproteobacteria bacterium]
MPALVVCGIDARARTETVERLLKGSGQRWAVISNETDGPAFAAAATERIAGQMVPHAIGCLCCITRSGLVSSLRRLFARRAQGEILFDRVLIETLADTDPAPVMQTLLNNALVTEYFRLDSVVAVLAVGESPGTLARSRHGCKQLAIADSIVLDPAALAAPEICAGARVLNPVADLVPSDRSSLAEALIGAGLETRLLDGELGRWLGTPHYGGSDLLRNGLHGFAIEIPHELEWEALHGWLNAGTQTNGDVMYRTKGAVRIAGVDGPVIINGVQHVYQPPQRLPEVEVERSRLLFITANLDRAAVEDSLRIDLPQFQRLSEARAARHTRAASDPSIPL